MSLAVLEKLQACLLADVPVALVTIVGSTGSIPNEVGGKMLVGAGGVLLAGTVGGGEIEHQALREAAEALSESKHRKFKCHLTEKHAHGIGMMCGGSAEVFVEVYRPQAHLVLVGAGHVNLELARLARGLDYAVTVIDDRPEWASEANYPEAARIIAQPAEGFAQIRWVENAFLVIATRDQDTPALRAAVDLPCRYVGLVASKRKTVQILKNLQHEGLDLSGLLPRLRSPVGLDLGGKSPAAVALSILAEIQMVRHGKTGQPLSFVPDAPLAR
jgi:xanthine dehydrogenase accessory factor